MAEERENRSERSQPNTNCVHDASSRCCGECDDRPGSGDWWRRLRLFRLWRRNSPSLAQTKSTWRPGSRSSLGFRIRYVAGSMSMSIQFNASWFWIYSSWWYYTTVVVVQQWLFSLIFGLLFLSFFLLLFLAIVIAGCSSFRMQSIKSIHPIGINPLQRDATYQGQEGRYDRRRRASSVQQSIICIMVGGSNEGCTAGIGGTDKDDGTSSWNIDGKYYQCAPHRPLSDRKKSINAHDAYPYTTPSLCGTSCPCDTHTFPSLSILTI